MQDNTSLKSLVTALVDARNGYREAVKDAEGVDLQSLFQSMIALHERAIAELGQALLARGETADESGSFMSTVHETVIAVRSAITGLDAGSLSGFADGEKRILKRYDDAVADAQDDPALLTTLERQREALQVKVDGMERAAEQA